MKYLKMVYKLLIDKQMGNEIGSAQQPFLVCFFNNCHVPASIVSFEGSNVDNRVLNLTSLSLMPCLSPGPHHLFWVFSRVS